MSKRRATITAVGHYTPDKVLSNLDLEKMVDTTDEWIRTRTGIIERRIIENGASSDLAAGAVRSLLKNRVASPVYFFSVSAQAKMMVDRCQAFWSGKYLLHQPTPAGPFGRKGLILLVGAYRKSTEGVKCAAVCAASFMRTVNVTEHRCVSVLGPDQAGSIREYPDSLREATEAGRWLMEA